MTVPLDVPRLRAEFPILGRTLPDGKRLVYLDSAATSHKPNCVVRKLVECLEQYNSNVHRGAHSLGNLVTEELETAREKIRAFIGAASIEEIVFTSGTTASINLVANAWGRTFLQPGDEVLINEMEHHSNLVPWQMITKERGAALRYIPLTPDGRLDLDQLGSVLSARTKLVALTAMSNVLGTINPVDEIVRRAHAVGAVVLVDGAQSVPHQRVDMRASQVDFFAFSGHKMYGPTGIGVLYGRKELLLAMHPFLGGGNMIRRVWKDRFDCADLPSKFEAGTPPFAEAIALGTAVDFINELGFDAISQHEHRLTEYAFESMSAIPGLHILGPGLEHRGAIVSFVIDGAHPQDVAEILDQQGVAVRAGHHCTMPLHDLLKLPASARASFAIYNTLEEINALVEAIHTARRIFRL